MSAPVIRTEGGNYRPFGHRAYIGGGLRRTEAKASPAPGHRSYTGIGGFRTFNDMTATVQRREQELLRRDLWLNCERAPFDRAHP